MLNGINQSQKDRYHIISVICGIWTNWTDKQNRDRLIGREQDDSYWGGRLRDGGMEWKGKRTQQHGQHYGDCSGEEGIKGYMVMEKIQWKFFKSEKATPRIRKNIRKSYI